jgi:hypothetical protein
MRIDGIEEKSYQLAKDIIESAYEYENELFETTKEMRAHIRGTRLYMPENYRSDMTGNRFNDYNDFRRKNIGRFILTNNPNDLHVDSFYQELSELYPEFFPDDIINIPGQLLQIADVYNSLKPEIVDPFEGADIEPIIKNAQAAILESVGNVKESKPTFADKKEAERQRVRDKAREATRRKLNALRDENNKKITELKDYYRAREKDARQRQDDRTVRVMIKRTVDRMAKKLLKPSDTQHVPDHLRGVIAEFLQNVNLDSKRPGTAYWDKLNNMQAAFAKIIAEDDSNASIDAELIGKIEEAKAYKDIPILAYTVRCFGSVLLSAVDDDFVCLMNVCINSDNNFMQIPQLLSR